MYRRSLSVFLVILVFASLALQAEALPKSRVLLLATGGTIAGVANTNSTAGYDAGVLTCNDMVNSVPGLRKEADIKAEQICNIASQDMTYALLHKLALRINTAFANNEADAVVVTHGTDTLEETAFFLDLVVKGNKPVVIVGAMRPSTDILPDGPGNLLDAVKVAVNPQSQGRGVLVALNGIILKAGDAAKLHTNTLQAFDSSLLGACGYINQSRICYTSAAPAERHSFFDLAKDSKPLPKVDIIYCHTDMDADVVDFAIKNGAKGIVLAGVGDGNASKPVIASLTKAAEKGVAVVRASRIDCGAVLRNVELNDEKLGFVASHNLNPQKSRILLQLLLQNNINDPEKIQKYFYDI